MNQRLTAIVEREGAGYVALCPEVDVASQGDSVAQACANVEEALALFFETASPQEVERRIAAAKPRQLSGRQTCRVFELHGFGKARQRGSHGIMQ